MDGEGVCKSFDDCSYNMTECVFVFPGCTMYSVQLCLLVVQEVV